VDERRFDQHEIELQAMAMARGQRIDTFLEAAIYGETSDILPAVHGMFGLVSGFTDEEAVALTKRVGQQLLPGSRAAEDGVYVLKNAEPNSIERHTLISEVIACALASRVTRLSPAERLDYSIRAINTMTELLEYQMPDAPVSKKRLMSLGLYKKALGTYLSDYLRRMSTAGMRGQAEATDHVAQIQALQELLDGTIGEIDG
jgi:hypothetical protein